MAGTFCNFKIRLTTFHFDKFTVRARSGDLEASLSHTTLGSGCWSSSNDELNIFLPLPMGLYNTCPPIVVFCPVFLGFPLFLYCSFPSLPNQSGHMAAPSWACFCKRLLKRSLFFPLSPNCWGFPSYITGVLPCNINCLEVTVVIWNYMNTFELKWTELNICSKCNEIPSSHLRDASAITEMRWTWGQGDFWSPSHRKVILTFCAKFL